jgi:DNA-binding winged helix-turn-helix (wHTH) protein
MKGNGESNRTISFAEFELDTAHRRLLRDGKPLALYAKTFDLLTYLLEHNGEIVTKDEVLETVWKGQFVEEANLSVQISALRKALGEKKDTPRFLITVPGKGYKFVADVRNGSNEIVIEKHKFSRVVVEEDLEEVEGENRTDKGSERKFPVLAFYLLFFAFLLCIGLGGFWAFNKVRGGFFANDVVEKQPKIRKLTNTGKVSNAVLSPDGRFFAYSEFDKPNWQTSIRIAQVDGSSDVVLRPVADVIYRVTAFSADGGWLYFTAAEPKVSLGTLFKVPVLGGVPQKLADGVHGFLRLSPDEKQIAFVHNDKGRSSTLSIANTDGSDQHELAVRPYDRAFFAGSLSWSADGRSIAVGAAENQKNNDDVNSFEVFAVSVSDGTVNQLTHLEWSEINRVEWLKDGSGLAVVGREKESVSKIRFVARYGRLIIRAVKPERSPLT